MCVILMNASFPIIILYIDMYTSWWSAAGGRRGGGSGMQPPQLPVAAYMNVCVCVILLLLLFHSFSLIL